VRLDLIGRLLASSIPILNLVNPSQAQLESPFVPIPIDLGYCDGNFRRSFRHAVDESEQKRCLHSSEAILPIIFYLSILNCFPFSNNLFEVLSLYCGCYRLHWPSIVHLQHVSLSISHSIIR